MRQSWASSGGGGFTISTRLDTPASPPQRDSHSGRATRGPRSELEGRDSQLLGVEPCRETLHDSGAHPSAAHPGRPGPSSGRSARSAEVSQATFYGRRESNPTLPDPGTHTVTCDCLAASSSIVMCRPTRQSGRYIWKRSRTREQSSREFYGRAAGAGYSRDGISTSSRSVNDASPIRARQSSNIASANPCQLVSPAAHRCRTSDWKRPC